MEPKRRKPVMIATYRRTEIKIYRHRAERRGIVPAHFYYKAYYTGWAEGETYGSSSKAAALAKAQEDIDDRIEKLKTQIIYLRAKLAEIGVKT
jgi:hypothetical protein